MFRHRILQINEDYDTVVHRLNEQKRRSFLTDYVDGNRFLIHKSVMNTRRHENNFYLYEISGSLEANADVVTVQYVIKPQRALLIMFGVFLLVTIYALIQTVFRQGNPVFFIVSIVIPLVMYIMIQLEAKECRKAFEGKLMRGNYV